MWFLAPTVSLCRQQHLAIGSYLPALRMRLLVGSDNVDRWSDQDTWDAALQDMDCVVSTHAVLADALAHGFVRMHRLSLLIFDEGELICGGPRVTDNADEASTSLCAWSPGEQDHA